MPLPPPVDDHTPDFEELAGLSVLGVMDDEEQARFEAHYQRCQRCQVMVRLDGQTLHALNLTAPDMDPSPDFKARLMRRAAAELNVAAPGDEASAEQPATDIPRLTDVSRPANVVPFYRRTAVLRALAALFVIGLLSVGAFTYENQPVARVSLHGDAPGEAVVIVRRSGAADLEMHNVADPEPGYVYEAWIIPPGQQPIGAGVLTRGTDRVALEGDVRGATVAITREPGRLPAPTGQPLMVGTIRS